jgi:type I restriction enzyme R subunit
MPTPGEHKTFQTRILDYAEAINWSIVSQEEAEQRRSFDLVVSLSDRAKNRSLFFEDLLDAKIRELNPRYAEAVGASLGQFRHLHSDIYGNREFVEHLRNRGKFLVHDETRELDLILIDGNKAERIALGMVGGAAL